MSPPPILTRPFLLAALGNFLLFTSLAGFLLLPLHLKELGATEAQLGLIMGCYSGTAIFCQPVVGAWVDRAGRRPFLVSGAGLTGAAALLFAAAPDALGLFPLLRVLQGLAFSLYSPSRTSRWWWTSCLPNAAGRRWGSSGSRDSPPPRSGPPWARWP